MRDVDIVMQRAGFVVGGSVEEVRVSGGLQLHVAHESSALKVLNSGYCNRVEVARARIRRVTTRNAMAMTEDGPSHE